jgi:hypothetical protein
MEVYISCRLITPDIEDLYVNIPISETLHITKSSSSISGIIDELFLHDEKLYMKHILGNNSILYYIRYVVDILMLINHDEVIEYPELLNT